ncbi:hypothetical protein CHS0354_036637 [Potamilus streckersoni]|uniref:Uncharacterized protein n=1 Tax=Potamilus streckersoni TaxID=2493646 RepID=A0AAE0SSH7_9BIVA|nr:hypothetical protein CHS0354_036637 [Potamilus streckersoni]
MLQYHAVIKANAPGFLPSNITTLPQKLKEVGYVTHMVGKDFKLHCSKIPTADRFSQLNLDGKRNTISSASKHLSVIINYYNISKWGNIYWIINNIIAVYVFSPRHKE